MNWKKINKNVYATEELGSNNKPRYEIFRTTDTEPFTIRRNTEIRGRIVGYSDSLRQAKEMCEEMGNYEVHYPKVSTILPKESAENEQIAEDVKEVPTDTQKSKKDRNIEIKEKYENGASYKSLAREYGLAVGTIKNICRK